MATQSKSQAATSAPNYKVPFIIVTALFGIFGFLTNLNSNLAPKLEDIFNLNHMWSNFVTTCLVPGLPGLLGSQRQADRDDRLQAHHGDFAFHHGGGRSAVHPGCPHCELPGLS